MPSRQCRKPPPGNRGAQVSYQSPWIVTDQGRLVSCAKYMEGFTVLSRYDAAGRRDRVEQIGGVALTYGWRPDGPQLSAYEKVATAGPRVLAT